MIRVGWLPDPWSHRSLTLWWSTRDSSRVVPSWESSRVRSSMRMNPSKLTSLITRRSNKSALHKSSSRGSRRMEKSTCKMWSWLTKMSLTPRRWMLWRGRLFIVMRYSIHILACSKLKIRRFWDFIKVLKVNILKWNLRPWWTRNLSHLENIRIYHIPKLM